MVKVFISDHKLVPHHTVNGLTEVGRWITILSLQIFILQVFWKKLGGVVPMQLLCKLAQRNNCLGFLCFQREELRLSEPKSREYLALSELVFASGVWQHGVLDAKPSDVFPGVHGAGQLGGGWEASLHCSAQLELPCLGSLWSLSRKESLEMQQVFQHTANQLVNLWFSYRQVETKFSFLLIYPHALCAVALAGSVVPWRWYFTNLGLEGLNSVIVTSLPSVCSSMEKRYLWESDL